MRGAAVLRLTIRARLTLAYGALALVSSAATLTVLYLLVLLTAGPVIQFTSPTGDARSPTSADFAAADDVEAFNDEIARAEEEFTNELNGAVITYGGTALAVITVLAGWTAWAISRRAVRPIGAIAATARRVARADTGHGLHERVPLDGPDDELKELGTVVNQMLERLDHAFDGQRRFVANASHELRTPLAINRALVEVAVTRPGATEDMRRLGESLLLVNGRHERLIDGLLTLADSENELTTRDHVDLAEIAAHALGGLTDDAEAHHVTVRPPRLEPGTVAGDPVLLERMVGNLVENAARHNLPAGGWLAVSTRTTDDHVLLTVNNTGPTIGSYEIPALFAPFQRRSRAVGPDTTRGFGLGLSIVRAVVGAHGGRLVVTARDPDQTGGLCVLVELPRADASLAEDPARLATAVRHPRPTITENG